MPQAGQTQTQIDPRVLAEMAVEAEPRLLTTAIMRAQLLRCAMQGLNATQAAVIVRCSAATARHVYADPSFKAEVLRKVEGAFEGVDLSMVRKKQTTFERIQGFADRAFDELVVMLEDEQTPRGLRARIAMDVLDRVPETRAGEVHDHKHAFDPTQLAHAAQVATEMNNALFKLDEVKEIKSA